MFNDVAEILNLTTEHNLRNAFVQFEQELMADVEPLESLLNTTVQSMDPGLNFSHAALVDAWRNKVSKYLMFTRALVEHAKSDVFSLPQAKGITELVRDERRRGLAGPFVALQMRLEEMLDGIDNRVNFCKKCIAVEEAGRRGSNNRSEF